MHEHTTTEAYAKHELKQYKEAIGDFDKAIELNPKDAYAYYNRGNAKHDLKQYKEAIADFDKAIELNPKDASLMPTTTEAAIASLYAKLEA